MRILAQALGGITSRRARLARMPLTVGVTTVVLGAGVATGAPFHRVSTALLDRWGVSLFDCLHRDAWVRILTSLPFSAGGTLFWKVLLLSTVAVALGELVLGWMRTALIILVVHVLAMYGELVLFYPWRALPTVHHLLQIRDMGFSEGAYGCLAIIGWRLPNPQRVILWSMFGLGFTTNSLLHLVHHDLRGLSADAGHGIGIVVACLLAISWRGPRRPAPIPMPEAVSDTLQPPAAVRTGIDSSRK